MKFGFSSGKNKSGKPNIDSNLNPFGKPANNGGNGGGTNQPPPNQPPANQNNDANTAFMKFCRDQGMFEDLDLGGFVAAVREGDAEKASEFFMNSMISTARVAMAGADRLATAKMTKAMEESVTRATAVTHTNLAVQEMNNRLGFTRDPAIAPVAEQVLNGFLARGDNADTALDNVEKYFKEFALTAGSQFGMAPPNNDLRPGQRGFNDSRMQQNDNTDDGQPKEMDWLDVLTSGNVTAATANSGGGNGSNGGDGGQAGGNGGNANSAAA